MMKPRLALVALNLALVAAACDAQTGPDYPGSPLLTISGTVEGQVPDVQIVPALAFPSSDGKGTYLMDLDVEGEFPTGFSMRVFDAPPAPAITTPDSGAGWGPAAAVGRIVAVRADHPPVVFDHFTNVSESCVDPPGTCVREETIYGASNEEILYQQRSVCDMGWQNCETTTTGDPSVAVGITDVLRGVVTNYLVAYFASDVSTRSVVGSVYGALPAGYHLVSVHDATETETAAVNQCSTEATNQALATFNASHGTSYTNLNQVPSDDPALPELRTLFFDELAARNCRLNFGVVVNPVPDGPEHPVTMQISNDPSLLDQSYL